MEFTMKLRKHKSADNRSIKSNTKLTKAPTKKKSKTKSCGICVCKPVCKSCELAEYPQVWTEFRKKTQLCDGIVRCEDGVEFKIHRVILSSISPYFKALFTNSINRSNSEIHESRLPVPSDIFSIFLDYAYTGQCTVTESNVERLIMYADQFEILGIVQQCCEVILNRLEINNCLEVLKFAQQYFCQELERRGKRFVRKNFSQVFKENPEFTAMEIEDLIELLESDDLNVVSEETTFEAIKLWVETSSNERKCYVPRLLQCARLGNTDPDYIMCCVRPWAVSQDRKCKSIIKEAEMILDKISENMTQQVDARCPLRRPRIPDQILFAVGGWSAGSPTNFVETYDNRANKWLLSNDTDFIPRAYHGLCSMRGLIYMIGGFDGNEHFNTVRSFNPATHTWKECACMYYPRCYVSVVVLNDKIYALGGYNGRTRMSSVERYDPDCNQWELVTPMQQQRSDASAATLNNKIYVVGGFNGQEVMNSAEYFDPSNMQWTYIPSMLTARSGVSLIAYGNCLYALGGFNGFNRLTSAEKYVPGKMSEWAPILDMFCPRSNFASAILDDIIYAIGGFNDRFVAGSTTIAFVECYNPEINAWREASSMNLNRSALSACVLTNLENAKEYSYLGLTNTSARGEDGGEISELDRDLLVVG